MCLGAITITPTVQLVPKPDNLLHYTHQRRYSLAERGTVCTRQIIQRAQTTGDLFGIEIKRGAEPYRNSPVSCEDSARHLIAETFASDCVLR